jgi:hypothetical protein
MPREDVILSAQDLISADLDSFLAQENDEPSEDSPADWLVKQVEEGLNAVGLTIAVFRRQ